MFLLDTNVIAELRKLGDGKADARGRMGLRAGRGELFHMGLISIT